MMKKREKYREDLLDDEDLLEDDEDGGVLSDYEDEPDDETATGAR